MLVWCVLVCSCGVRCVLMWCEVCVLMWCEVCAHVVCVLMWCEVCAHVV